MTTTTGWKLSEPAASFAGLVAAELGVDFARAARFVREDCGGNARVACNRLLAGRPGGSLRSLDVAKHRARWAGAAEALQHAEWMARAKLRPARMLRVSVVFWRIVPANPFVLLLEEAAGAALDFEACEALGAVRSPAVRRWGLALEALNRAGLEAPLDGLRAAFARRGLAWDEDFAAPTFDPFFGARAAHPLHGLGGEAGGAVFEAVAADDPDASFSDWRVYRALRQPFVIVGDLLVAADAHEARTGAPALLARLAWRGLARAQRLALVAPPATTATSTTGERSEPPATTSMTVEELFGA